MIDVPAATAAPAAPATELTAAAAQAQIAALSNNAEWATKLLAGDPGARLEFDRLSAVVAGVKTIDFATTTGVDADTPFVTTSGKELSPRNLRAAVVDLAESGMLPLSIDQIIDGTYQVSPDEYRIAEQSYRSRTTDREYVARYLAGGAVERREMTILNALLMAGPKAEKEAK